MKRKQTLLEGPPSDCKGSKNDDQKTEKEDADDEGDSDDEIDIRMPKQTVVSNGKTYNSSKNSSSLVNKKINKKKKLSYNQQFKEEWDALAEEEHAYQQLKRGKITKEEYEKRFQSDLV